MSKYLYINFKDSDLCWEYLKQAVPGDQDDPKVEAARDKLSNKLFEFDEYGTFAVDPKTGTGKLVPRK